MLTTAQLQALKAAIDADPVLSAQPNTNVGNSVIAQTLNAPALPEFIVWRNSVTTDEVGNAVNYVAVEAMTDANRNRINTFYTMNPSSFSPVRSDVRSYWDNTFSGALGGQGAATRAALDALWRRAANGVEKILATGTGTTVSPAVLGYEGTITPDEIEQARSL
jgi:hypothetical protein